LEKSTSYEAPHHAVYAVHISFIKILNENGPKVNLCGTPDFIVQEEEEEMMPKIRTGSCILLK
jgi:hypothetical protein